MGEEGRRVEEEEEKEERIGKGQGSGGEEGMRDEVGRGREGGGGEEGMRDEVEKREGRRWRRRGNEG